MRFKSLVCLCAAVWLTVLPSLACGPFFPEAILSLSSHPDLPLRQFARGNLGILRPSMARSYLVVAYRYLNGKPLSAKEQEQALALWNYRLLNYAPPEPNDELKAWLAARQTVTSEKIEDIYSYRNASSEPDSYESYLNCTADAFNNATDTLKQRIARYGAGSPTVKSWVKAQDGVFCHCYSPRYNYDTKKTNPEPAFPAAAAADDDALTRFDRAYQIAAAHFYAQQFDQARQEFEAIAADSASPWSSLAPYLVARCFIRQATLARKLDEGKLAQAVQTLQALLADPKEKALYAGAHKLLSFVELRLHPVVRLHALATELQDPGQADNFENNLYDYTQLVDNQLGVSSDDAPEAVAERLKFSAIPATLHNNDLTDWIITFQASGADAHKHAVEQYRRTNSSAWLLAALTSAGAADGDGKMLLEKAAAIGSSTAGDPSLGYAAVRLLQAQGLTAKAEQKLQELLTISTLPRSAINLLLDEKLTFIKTFDEFLKLAVRQPATVSSNEEGIELPDDADKVEAQATFPTYDPVFDDQYWPILNQQLPLELLVQAAKAALPAQLRQRAVNAVWTRAILLGDAAAAKTLTPLFKAANPPMAPLVNTYQQAAPGPEQKFAAVFLMLHNPGMRPYIDTGVGRQTVTSRIDDFGDNWWCAEPAVPVTYGGGKPRPRELNFLSQSQTAAGRSQAVKLKTLGAAPNFLAAQTLAWAGAHPSDPRLPEALSLVVKATRFGCKDSQTSKLSKESFQLLHNKYPGSAWTKKTPYWY